MLTRFCTIVRFICNRKGALFFITVLRALSAHGQDLEHIRDQKIISVNGGVSANTTFYDANGIDNRRDPFYWMLNANLTFDILGIIQAPFSMTISQQDKTFSQPQPFNRFGISPRYKNVTGHFGHRTMNFSDYTLAGNMFLGAGVEVNPKESFVRFSAMYGQLAKAVERSAQEGLVFAKPTFRRMGYGMMVGLGKDKHTVDLIFFRGADDPNSIVITGDVEVTPEENLVGAIHSKHQVTQRVSVELEYAHSLFTRDKRAIVTGDEKYSFFNNFGSLFRPNMSSESNRAFTTVLNYTGDKYQANIKYRNIDPGYRTLGSSFLNNGLKDVTGGLSWSMLQQKVSISTNAGFQQSTKETSVVRIVYSVNAGYNDSKRLNVTSTYSNFSTSTRQTQIQTEILVDTLEYFQVTRNSSVNMNYRLGKPMGGGTLMFALNIQDATDSDENETTFYALSAGHQIKVAHQWNVSLSGIYNRNVTQDFENTTRGPLFSVNRSFREGKYRSAFSVAMLNSYLEDSLQSKVLNASVTNNFRIGKKHSFAVNFYYLKNEQISEAGKEFREIRGMLNYNYNF